MSRLIDGFGRKHDYLRVSVTDRCNLRCVYCMGADGVKHIPHSDILSYEEILQVIRCGAKMGISKIRLTGGEPLIRKNLLHLVKEISLIKEIKDISMTTNATLLSQYAERLKEAGLQRVNISLDTLNPSLFKKITREGDLQDALKGIESAIVHGLEPVKINMVLLKGYNDGEILDFIKLAQKKNVHVRFIEYMRIGKHDDDYEKHYLPLSTVQETAAKAGITLKPVRHPLGAGPAECFFISDKNGEADTGGGTIGLIHSISHHFCNKCNRLRLTADGRLKSCLYWQDELTVRPALGDNNKLENVFMEALSQKHRKHQMEEGQIINGKLNGKSGKMRSMSRTGG